VISSVEPEAGPLVLLEAMSIGVPVVATNHGGPPEVLGEAGLLVPPGDPDAMAEAIQALLDDHSLRRRCAQAGPRQVAQGHTLDGQIQALLDVVLSQAGVTA
jgi:glycosyltransferase involved in cell wall biosynthesis